MAKDLITKGTAVAPNDSTVVDYNHLYVGSAGDLAVRLKDDSAAVTLKAVPVGTMLHLSVSRVMATNTTATWLVGFA